MLAVALALAGRDLLLVDGDEQGTALTFTQLRAERLGEAGYTAVALTGAGTLAPATDKTLTLSGVVSGAGAGAAAGGVGAGAAD